MAEGRLSRWSRLKSKGGADAREEAQVETDKLREDSARAEPPDEFAGLPGGRRVRSFVPAMAPLAPAPEDDDDRFTRGVGYVDTDDDGDVVGGDGEAVSDAATVLENEDLFAGIEEEELSEEEREVVAELPPLETLDKDSDFSPFLRDGVPEFMKRRALRLLWRLNPFFNFRDGLNDYDQDFNVVHKIIDEMTGAYKVGRGHLTDQELRDMTPERARRAFGDEEPTDQELVEGENVDPVDSSENEPVPVLPEADDSKNPERKSEECVESSLEEKESTKTHKKDTLDD
ncbi:MAG: DUF3306 domain-containing protein [Rhodospirillales bacterium]|nr:DUF3306 domain-containing protein [Rhodospirillales bacterium]